MSSKSLPQMDLRQSSIILLPPLPPSLPPVTNTTKDMTTIQIISQQEYKQIQEVQIETRLIQRIDLFNDMLQCMADGCDKVIPFPPQYSEVAMVYINFINSNYVNQYDCNILKEIEDGNLLCQALKLCHYLDDNYFLKFLVHWMQGNIDVPPSSLLQATAAAIAAETAVTTETTIITEINNCASKYRIPIKWACHHDMITSLPDNLQRDIYLLTPYALIPDRYQNDESFFDLWVKTNVNTNGCVVMHMIDGAHYYSTYVRFYNDNLTDIKQFNC